MAKISELIKKLKADGWYVYRHGRKHDLYKHTTKSGTLTIPRHGSKEVAKGTLMSILRKAGLN